MNFSQEEFEQILSIFQDESTEIVNRFANHLVSFEKEPENTKCIANLFQDAHSIKGAARMVGFHNIQNIAHKIEDILSLLKEKKLAFSHEIISAMYKASDLLLYLIENSVKYKNDFYCDSIITTTNLLDKIVQSQDTTIEQEYNNESAGNTIFAQEATEKLQQKSIEEQIPNISALLLESIFITERYSKDEKETFLSVLSDNIIQLISIFECLEYCELKEQLHNFSLLIKKYEENPNLLTEEKINNFKYILNEIQTSINILYEKLSVPPLPTSFELSEAAASVEEDEATENDKSINTEQQQIIKEQLDYLSGNISQIKNDKSYIENSKKHLTCLIEMDISSDINKIYQKMSDILELINKPAIKPDDDVISVLSQSINMTKKIILDNEKEDQEDLSLLHQRLSIIEQMIDITNNEESETTEPKPLKQSMQPQFQKIQDFFNMFEIGAIKTLRVDTKKLDALIGQTGELLTNSIKTQKHLTELDNVSSKLADWNLFLKKTFNYIKYFEKRNIETDDSLETVNHFHKQLIEIFQMNIESVNELVQDVNELYKQVNEYDIKTNHIITEVENIVKSVRVLPLATVFHMFPRMVRDIADNNNKKVELYISGGDTSVDKKIIEEIKIPLIHILRNSIDHGIETPEERIKNNKPPIGKIHLSASYTESKIIIEIKDDGTGINLAKVKQKVLDKGILTNEELNSMSDEQIMNLIFIPGFSTGEQITEISGRGIGLDVVQTKISQLNGKIKVYSAINQGATVIIELPISMSTLKSFIVTINNAQFAIPMNMVKSVQTITKDKIFTQDDNDVIIYQNQTIPIVELGSLLNVKTDNLILNDKFTTIIMENENQKIAYIVDKLIGDQEILHKKFTPPVYKIKNISGISTLASGDLCLIVNVPELLKNTLNTIDTGNFNINKLITSRTLQALPTKNYKILLVDDSKTTLALIERILLSKGYNVTACFNSREAMLKLKQERFDLLISDVKMPDFGGKDLAMFVKSDENLVHLPIIIISTISIVKMKEIFKNIEIEYFVHKLKFNKDLFLDKIETIFRKKER